MFSMEPKVSMWRGPMLVSMPYFGRTRSTNSLMSPTWVAPISAMKTWCSGFSWSLITRETPMAVLKLAGVASTLYLADSMSRRMNLTLVLP